MSEIIRMALNIIDYEFLRMNIIDIIIFIYVIYYFVTKSLYLGIIMNESIIIGIDLFKTCFLFDYKKRLCSTIMSIIKPSTVNIDTIITYDKYNKLVEQDMRNIIKKVNNKYIKYRPDNIRTFNKYIFYLLLLIISYLYKILFWTNNDLLINIFLLMLTLRPFKTIIYNFSYFGILVNKVQEAIKKIICYILSKLSVVAITDLNMICIGINPNVKYYELLNFFENIYDYKDNIMMIIKSILNHFIITSFKKSSSPLIKYIFTFIHKYQIEELSYVTNILNSSTDANLMTKKDIGEIITNKKWDKLLLQKSINSILHILKNENNDKKYITNNTNEFMFSLLRYFTLWTFVYVNPLIAVLIDLIIIYKIHFKLTVYHVISYIIGLYILLFSSLEVGTLICIYGNILLKVLYNFIKDINIYRLYNELTVNIITSLMIGIGSNILITNNMLMYKYYLVQMSYYFYKNYKITPKYIIMLILYVLSLLQNFNIIHMMIINTLFYIVSVFNIEPKYKLSYTLNEKYIKMPNVKKEAIETKWLVLNYEGSPPLTKEIVIDDNYMTDQNINIDNDIIIINNDDKEIDNYVILDNYIQS